MQKMLAILLALLLITPVWAAETQDTQITQWLSQSELPAGYVPYYNPVSAEALAKMMYGEGGANLDEHAATCWVAINRVNAGYGSLLHVLSAPGQFVGYRQKNPVTPLLYDLAKDVLIRWDMERCGYTDVGRVLPGDYKWFTGSKGHNWVRNKFSGGKYWDFSWPSPYQEG